MLICKAIEQLANNIEDSKLGINQKCNFDKVHLWFLSKKTNCKDYCYDVQCELDKYESCSNKILNVTCNQSIINSTKVKTCLNIDITPIV